MNGEEDCHANSYCAKNSQKQQNGGVGNDFGDMSFMMIDYIKEAMKSMDMMRSHHMLTDVVLEVGCELFHAHRVVLAAASPYFKAMFTGGLKECDMNRVKLQGVSATAMARLIHFMYTGRIRVTENTVCQLLPAATMLQVPLIADEWKKMMTNHSASWNFLNCYGAINGKHIVIHCLSKGRSE